MHNITWNGVSSDTIGIRIERAARIIRPRRKADIVSIPGRNGDIVFFQDAWENYTQPYEIFFGTGADLSAETAADAVSEWLHSADGYARLEDTYEPDIYRMAYYLEEQDIYNAITEYGRTTIRFNCRPERFLKVGQMVNHIGASGNSIPNPTDFIETNLTKFYARPLIRINFHATQVGNGTMTISGSSGTYSVSVAGARQYIWLDCDLQNAYRTETENQNDLVTITQGGDFPRLVSGENIVTFTGNILSVDVQPRWFII